MRFRFADCELDAARCVLRRDGRPVRVEPKVFDLLLLLARARGELVSKQTLYEELWDGVTVTEASLRRIVKEARRAVGDDGRAQRLIATVHGRGQRLVVPVRRLGARRTRPR